MRKRLAIALSALAGLALTFSGSAQPPSKLQHLISLTWSEDFDAFGGLSALELADNGRDFLAISDRMHLMQGQLIRRDGQITGVELSRHQSLRDAKGSNLKVWNRDSEGLALRPDGTLYVSLESINQIWHYPTAFGPAKALPRHPDFRKMHRNAALEALAVDGRGRLYTVPEVRPKSRPGLPLYRYSSKGWQILYYIDVQEGFDPVAADFGPDGQFYLLERKFGGIGFRSRLRRFDLGKFDPKGEHLLTTALGQHDNLEGLSVWRDPQGQTRLTMVSDDNFKFFQRSEIVEYVLTETLAKAAATH
ncbi:esterase-like activity of phytase family protein [Thalassobius sp. MITS945101]|uniref:esterase-like activity of phytase family protein n=1 Tax=Thalassobius sp. MITS945101 TaxID=3096994 RepID=UPI00399A1841